MQKFGHGFHEFFFKVQHREKEYCDDYCKVGEPGDLAC